MRALACGRWASISERACARARSRTFDVGPVCYGSMNSISCVRSSKPEGFVRLRSLLPFLSSVFGGIVGPIHGPGFHCKDGRSSGQKMFENRDMSQSKLYVGNHSFDTGEAELRDAFSAYGQVRSVDRKSVV